MEINRRQFGLLVAAGLFAPPLLAKPSGQQATQHLYAAAAQTGADQYALLIANSQGQLHTQYDLAERAHHVAVHPHQSVVAVVARRPGTHIDIVDYTTYATYDRTTATQRLTTSAGYHLYGHGIFTPDGRYLLTTEQCYAGPNAAPEGLIVWRDSWDNYRVVREFYSGGIGPHELKLMADGKTLVVANGGISTHPDTGRNKLNLETMQPTLAYIDLASGKLLEQAIMPEEYHQLSIRHLDISAQGRVVLALQYEGDKTDSVPLVAFHTRGSALSLAKAPEHINFAMKHYCGSARFDRTGEIAAISSPRGDLITFWSQQGEFIDAIRSKDGCGVSATTIAHEFLITTGRGHCYQYQAKTGVKQRLKRPNLASLSWDNHLSRLGSHFSKR